MTESSEKKPVISFKNIEDSDPVLVKVFPIALKLYDLLEEQIQTIGMRGVNGRDNIAKARWTMYIGTLFAENYLASAHLSVLEMPRSQVILNRQLFEYFIRNQWLLIHSNDAADLLDSLPKIVQGEVTRSGVFDADMLDVIEKQYETWQTTSPLANLKIQEATIKAMVDELCQGDSKREYFYLYSMPSLIAHARPHGITDVLKMTTPGQFERWPNSLWFNRLDALNQAIGLAFQYASLLTGHFECDTKLLNDLNNQFGKILIELEQKPELVAVKFKP